MVGTVSRHDHGLLLLLLDEAEFTGHVWDLDLSQLRHGLQLQFAGVILFTVASYFTKLSLLAFYRRLLTSSNYKPFNLLLILVFVLWTAMFFWFLIDYFRICR